MVDPGSASRNYLRLEQAGALGRRFPHEANGGALIGASGDVAVFDESIAVVLSPVDHAGDTSSAATSGWSGVNWPSMTVLAKTTQLQRLRGIASAINQSGALETILDRVLSEVCRSEPWSRGGIMAINRASGYSELVAGYNPGETRRADLPKAWPLATSPALLVSETRRPLVIEDAQHAIEFTGYREDACARGYRTVVLLPLGCTNEDEHEMVLSIHTSDRIDVSEHEIDFLVTVAHLVAIAVEKSKRLQRERRQTERLRTALDLGASLMALVLEGAPIGTVSGVVSAILPDPFVILDLVGGSTTVRHSAATDTMSERDWSALVQGPAASLLAALIGRAGPGGADLELDLVSIGVKLTLAVVVEPLRVQGETVGALLIFPRERRLDALDRLVAQDVRFALGAHLMSQHAEAKRAARDLSDFFGQLCRGGVPDAVRARSQGLRLGLDLTARFGLLAVMLPGAVGVPPGEVRRLLAASLARTHPSAFVVEFDNVVAVGLPMPDAMRAHPARSLERGIAQPLRARWNVQPIIACGPCCAAPADYAPAWAECCRVMDLARIFRRDGPLRQTDFGPSALLLSAFDSDLSQAFVEETLGALQRYDAQHAGALLQTAVTLVDEGCRYQAAAHRLGIHVSTLRYRLKRVKALSGLDLQDPEARFRLSLASRLSTAGPREACSGS